MDILRLLGFILWTWLVFGTGTEWGAKNGKREACDDLGGVYYEAECFFLDSMAPVYR
jgi:hypothetical protein